MGKICENSIKALAFYLFLMLLSLHLEKIYGFGRLLEDCGAERAT
jgi:hypothetical protein